MRIFVAIELPQEIRKTLESLSMSLRRRLEGVRWVRPQGIHLTLRFIGETGQEEVDLLHAALIETVPTCAAPFVLTLRGLGTFPERGRPRVMWVPVEEEGDALIAVQRAVESASMRAGFEKEARPFRPHLTLGRFGRQRRPPKVGPLLEEYRDVRHGSFGVPSITIFRSILKPGGAEYTSLHVVGLEEPGK